MTDRDKIVRLATEVMGWGSVTANDNGVSVSRPDEDGAMYRVMLWLPAGYYSMLSTWNPLESIADAYDMEGAIPEERRADYLGHLECIASEQFDAALSCVWPVFHATPRQRCDAAIAMLEGKTDNAATVPSTATTITALGPVCVVGAVND